MSGRSVCGDEGSRCLKLKAKGDAEGDEMSKSCSPRSSGALQLFSSSLCVGHFTTEGLRGISMQNGMLLLNTGFLFSKGMFPFVLVTILNYLSYRAV